MNATWKQLGKFAGWAALALLRWSGIALLSLFTLILGWYVGTCLYVLASIPMHMFYLGLSLFLFGVGLYGDIWIVLLYCGPWLALWVYCLVSWLRVRIRHPEQWRRHVLRLAMCGLSCIPLGVAAMDMVILFLARAYFD